MEATGKELAVKPYKALWAACLLQVIEDCWLSSNTKDKRKNAENESLRDNARFYVNDMGNKEGGFVWICDIFDLDPVQTSNKILYQRSSAVELRTAVANQARYRKRHEIAY